MMTQNNVLYVFVATKSQSALPSGTVESISDGNVAVAKLDGTLVTSAITNKKEKVRLVKKVNGVLQFSPEFTISDLIDGTTATYSADSMFVGFLGYNGSEGDLVAEPDTIYTPKLVVRDSLTTFGNKAFIKEAVFKTSKTGPVYKHEVALGVLNNFNKNMAKEPEKFVKIGIVVSEAGTAMTAGSITAGSKEATVDSGVSVGDWIVDSNKEAFKILSKPSSTTAILDREAVISETNPATITSSVANADSTAWGIKFTGLPRTNFKAGIWKHMVYDFEILSGANMDDVLITETHAKLGTCTNEGVAEEEWFAQGNRGYGDRVDSIPVASQVTAEMTGANYAGLYIKSKLQQFTNVVGQSPASLIENKVYGIDSLITELKGVLGI